MRLPFTAGQAAKKSESDRSPSVESFTAGQAAKKNTSGHRPHRGLFTAGQAAKKLEELNLQYAPTVHCRTGS